MSAHGYTLSLRFSRARWSHCEAKSSAESRIPRRRGVGIDLISKITAVFSHRHDRSPAGSFLLAFLPSFLSFFHFSFLPSYHPLSSVCLSLVLSQVENGSRSCRCSKKTTSRKGTENGRARRVNTSVGVNRVSREMLREASRPRSRLESNLLAPAYLAIASRTRNLEGRYSERRKREFAKSSPTALASFMIDL